MAGDATANSPARHIVAVLEKNQLIEGQTDCMNSIIYVKKVPCFAKRKKNVNDKTAQDDSNWRQVYKKLNFAKAYMLFSKRQIVNLTQYANEESQEKNCH
jgi:hypothetical protein